MTDLGEFLELLHDAETRWTTVRATVKSRHDLQLQLDSWEDVSDEDGSIVMVGFSVDGGDLPDPPAEPESRVWLRQPSSWRVETDWPVGSVTASDGRTIGMRFETGLIEHDVEGDDQGSQFDNLFRPGTLLGAFEPAELAETETLGRPAIRARGPVRNRHWPTGFGHRADELEIVVDRERGVVLSATSFLGGKELSVEEVTEIVFDEPLADELFRLEAAEGEQIERPGDMDDVVWQTTLADAVRRASFPVWVPERLPELPEDTPAWDRWEAPDVMYSAAREGVFRVDENVHLHLNAGRKSISLSERAAAEPLDPGPTWEQVERAGRTLYVTAARGPMPLMILVELEGTLVQLTVQGLEPDAALDVAATLVRAEPEPPPVAG